MIYMTEWRIYLGVTIWLLVAPLPSISLDVQKISGIPSSVPSDVKMRSLTFFVAEGLAGLMSIPVLQTCGFMFGYIEAG